MASYIRNIVSNGNMYDTMSTGYPLSWFNSGVSGLTWRSTSTYPSGGSSSMGVGRIEGSNGECYISIAMTGGHKYYFRLWTSADIPNTITIKVDSTLAIVASSSGGTSSGVYRSFTFTATANGTHRVYLSVSGARLAEGSAYFSNIVGVDLTTTYGAGAEPTATTMDTVVSGLGNYWNGQTTLPTSTVTSIPLAVGNLITTDTTSASQVAISWNNPATDSNPVDGYKVYQKNTTLGEASGTKATLKSETWVSDTNSISGYTHTTAIVVNLDRNANDYQIGVCAFNVRGTGPINWITVNKLVTTPTEETPTQTVPATPANVSAIPGPSVGAITISWSTVPDANEASEVDGYQVFCTSKNIPNWTGLVYSDGSQFVQLDGKSWTYHEWKNLTIGVSYSFKVIAFNEAGGSANGTVVTATPMYQLPSVPQDFAVVKTDYQAISLTWTAPAIQGNPAVTEYRIYRQVKDIDGNVLESFSNAPYQTISSATTHWNEVALTVKRSYSYFITAASSKGESSKTSQKTIMLVGVPTAPTNFTVGIEDGTYPILRWNPCSDDGGEVPTRFKIYCDKTNGSDLIATIDGSDYDAVQIGCLPGETYYYKVSAVNSAGEGTKSSTNITIPSTNIDSKILVIGNRITNGSFDGDLGITNWTAEPSTCATFVEAPSGMFVDKALDIKDGEVFTEFEATAGHTYLLTCKCKAITGTIQAKLCDTESYVEKSSSSTFNISSTSVLRQFTTTHIYGTSGVRVLFHSSAGTEGLIDGVMLIDLSSIYGHNAVISIESVPYNSIVQVVNGFMGGYWEKTFTITKYI